MKSVAAQVENRILDLRGTRVILDRDLAEIYGIEATLFPRLSLVVAGVSDGFLGDGSRPQGYVASTRLDLLTLGRARVMASAGVQRDLEGSTEVWRRLQATADFGRLRLTTVVQSEHVLAPGRDPLDVALLAGVSYAVAGGLRLGGECMARDLEALTGDDAEGGGTFACGPALSVELPEQRLAFGVGTATGMTSGAQATLTRSALTYSF